MCLCGNGPLSDPYRRGAFVLRSGGAAGRALKPKQSV
jgi:hypothetical protein